MLVHYTPSSVWSESGGRSDVGRLLLPPLGASQLADRAHVGTIPADRESALATCLAGFLGVPFVRGALRVGGLASHGGEFSLPVGIDRTESHSLSCHGASLWFLFSGFRHSVGSHTTSRNNSIKGGREQVL